jgi:hypothetical protein
VFGCTAWYQEFKQLVQGRADVDAFVVLDDGNAKLLRKRALSDKAGTIIFMKSDYAVGTDFRFPNGAHVIEVTKGEPDLEMHLQKMGRSVRGGGILEGTVISRFA